MTANYHHHGVHFINGVLVSAQSAERIAVIDPTTEDVFGSVPAGTVDEVDAAVRAACAAFESWSATPPAVRAKYLTTTRCALPTTRSTA
jgi:aldehyde dehydrogenase (NAD+)